MKTSTKKMNRVWCICYCVGLLMTAAGSAAAATPDLIPVGGVLADSEGMPLDGDYDLRFRIYDAETEGNNLWEELRDGENQVSVTDGLFSVYLGEINNDLDYLDLIDAPALWLGISVGADPEMNRIQLASVPFAMAAQYCTELIDLSAQDIATQSWVGEQGYATPTWVEEQGYATPTWVEGQGYATQSWVGEQGYITSVNFSGVIGEAALAQVPECQNADTLDGAHASAFEDAGMVDAHEAAFGHLSNGQAAALTNGSSTTLHTHGALMTPPGMINMYGGSVAPNGWLLCDGSEMDRTTYGDLYAAIGDAYGAGDGSTTFNLPNLQQRFPLGLAATGTGSVMGETGGAIDHGHTFNDTVSENTTLGGIHGHSYSGNTDVHPNTSAFNRGDSAVDNDLSHSTHYHAYSGTTDTDGEHSHSLTDYTAEGTTGTSNPPFLTVNFVIKY